MPSPQTGTGGQNSITNMGQTKISRAPGSDPHTKVKGEENATEENISTKRDSA